MTLPTSSLVLSTASDLELADAFANPGRARFVVLRMPTVRSLKEIDPHSLHKRALAVILSLCPALVPAFAVLAPPVGSAAALGSPTDSALCHLEGGIVDGLGVVNGEELLVGLEYLRCCCSRRNGCRSGCW